MLDADSWRSHRMPRRGGNSGQTTLGETSCMLVQVNASRADSLTDQIVKGIQRLIEDRELLPGVRLPSIRRFAGDHRVSKFTVVRAYDRLAASGYLRPRHGAGFFVSKPSRPAKPAERGMGPEKATDVMWLMRRQYREFQFRHLPGGGWLPPQWLEENGLDRAMRSVSHWGTGSFLSGYGDPQGFVPLREDVGRRLADLGIDAPINQILFTNGISGAIDLVGRYLLGPDDYVLVDDPGHYQTFAHLRALGAKIIGIPWDGAGPDLEQVECAVKTHKPPLYVTTPIVHNPTGQSISRGTAFRLLQLAERYNFHILEDDTDGICNPSPPPRLASLDQLNRVIYVNGFSKILSPRLRVGFLAAQQYLVKDLVEIKALTQAASSEIAEQLVYEVLAHGHFRKHRAMLLDRIQRARDRAVRRLEDVGLGPVTDDSHGLFAWMAFPGVADTTRLAEIAAGRGMLLAPGSMFSPVLAPSARMRFNVAFCQDEAVFTQLEALLEEHARYSSPIHFPPRGPAG